MLKNNIYISKKLGGGCQTPSLDDVIQCREFARLLCEQNEVAILCIEMYTYRAGEKYQNICRLR